MAFTYYFLFLLFYLVSIYWNCIYFCFLTSSWGKGVKWMSHSTFCISSSTNFKAQRMCEGECMSGTNRVLPISSFTAAKRKQLRPTPGNVRFIEAVTGQKSLEWMWIVRYVNHLESWILLCIWLFELITREKAKIDVSVNFRTSKRWFDSWVGLCFISPTLII